MCSQITNQTEIDDKKLQKIAHILFQCIQKRTELLEFSPAKSVFEMILLERDFSLQNWKKTEDFYRKNAFFHQKNTISNPQKTMHWEEGVNFILQIFSQKNPDFYEYFRDFYEKNLCIGQTENSSFTTMVSEKSPKIFLYNTEGLDIADLIHESGHAYQMYLSRKLPYSEALPSIFVGEFCASFFECILLDFYENTASFSEKYQYLYDKKQENKRKFLWAHDFEISLYEAYQNRVFSDEKEFVVFLKQKKWYHQNIIAHSRLCAYPFYYSAYIFADVWSEKIYDKSNKFEIFSRIASQ